MKIEIIKEILSSRRNAVNTRAILRSPVQTSKGNGDHVVEKQSEVVIRTGIDYEALKDVIEGRADGTMASEPAPLPWGAWSQWPIHIVHTPKGETVERDYLRCYPASIEVTPKVSYFIDGKEATKEMAMAICRPSAFSSSDKPKKCFDVNCDNIISLGH
jgi:hypothetical protein